jgi:hypothetical protein
MRSGPVPLCGRVDAEGVRAQIARALEKCSAEHGGSQLRGKRVEKHDEHAMSTQR